MAFSRYVVRKENFGGLMYDRIEDAYIAIDKNFFAIIDEIDLTGTYSSLNEKYVAFFEKEEIIRSNKLNCTVIRNSFYDNNLSAPVRIHFCYTQMCNLNCKHCFTKLQKNYGIELSLNEKISMLDELKNLGISEILVGGGEPFIKKDILDFIDACNERGINIKIFTNGLLLDEQLCQELGKRDIKYISISIDGSNEEEYENTRGIRGLKKIIENIRVLKKYCSFPVAMSVTVNSDNYQNALGYLQIAKRANVDRIKVRPTKPSGNVTVNEKIYPTPKQYLGFINDMQVKWNKDYKNDFKLDFSWGDTRIKYDPFLDSMVVINNPFPYQGFGCFAGKGSMVIRANGDVSPCGFLPESMQTSNGDNIKEKSIKELWDTGIRFRNLRKITENGTCPKCEYYAVCRGGCIARILYDHRKINEIDPWCLKYYFPMKLIERTN